jgi:Fe/S biogenesis protein NfuA
MLHFSESARAKVLELMKAETRQGLALRFGIRGRGPGGFLYRLSFVEDGDRTPTDSAVDAGGFMVFVDAESAPHLQGVTIDFVTDARESGFKIDNPNPLWSDAQAQSVQRVLDEEINPAVAAHGGFVTLLDVKDDVVYIALGGGCQGCGMVDVTLKQGIEVRIREAVPAIRQIIDTTDHAGGTNPYYQPAKGGGASPFDR